MKEQNVGSPFRVVLSHVELLYLLHFFGATPAAGVDRDPLAGLSDEQITVALETAAAALRARDLLRFDGDQQPLLADPLLRVLGAYADPQQMLSAYRYRVDAELPLAFFAYVHEGDAVMHSRPADLLHEFSLLGDPSELFPFLAAFCAGGALGELTERRLALPARAVAVARAHADAGNSQEVMQVLREAGLSELNAQLLATDLVAPAALTAMTFLVQQPDTAPRRRDFIYWQSERPDSAMLLIEQGAEVLITDGGVASLATLINEMV